MKMLSLLLVGYFIVANVHAVEFQIRNNGGPTWIGIQGNPGHAHLKNGGFALNKGQSVSVNAPDNWGGRFWSRTECDSRSKHCLTGDCGNKLECKGAGGNPPATLVEIKLRGWQGKDFYDISLVDGFNNKASIEPINGKGDRSRYSCKKAKCGSNINSKCPKELRVNHKGRTIACNSACNAFRTPQYCCTGKHNKPQTCKSSSWPKDYPRFFKTECPDAYSYAYDDHKSTFTCLAKKYVIVFG